ncbi:MAG: hypothetical protein LBU89_09570 [Fibromonadaceae bacterium]|jgi:hypothetical protein|nr:hypothetical protein [Fibromonadaceae bacterium]
MAWKFLCILVLCLGFSSAFPQVTMLGQECAIVSDGMEAEDVLEMFRSYCLALGGTDKGGTIQLEKENKVVCHTCYLCDSYAAVDEVSKKQIACESDCG